MWKPMTTGRSGAAVEHGPGIYRKTTPDASLEAAALVWLRQQGLPAAEVLELGSDWLITREVVGRSGADPWPEDQRMRVVDALGEITAELRSLPVFDCPFDRTLKKTAAKARQAITAGRVNLDDLDDERRGWNATRLLDALTAQLPQMQAREVLAVTLGDWCLPNIILDPDNVTVIGLIVARRAGRADRYTDLALMSRSLGSEQLNSQYGSRYVQRYLSRCNHRSRGFSRLRLTVSTDNYGAQALYRRAGYSDGGVTPKRVQETILIRTGRSRWMTRS